MKRKWLFPTGFVFLLILGFFLIRSCNRSTTEQSTGEETARVVRRDMGSTVMATGIIKPMVGAEVKVGSRISGVVKQLSANIGDKVLKGQLLAELDDAELRAKLHQAEASLAKARTDSEYADLNVKRQRSLFAQNFISRQQVDLAENANEVASAQLKLAEANLDYARVQLNYSRIFSPTEGVIASVSTQEGETVSASLASPTFVSIIDLERLEVQTFVDETDIGKIQLGQEARFTIDTYSDTDFAGVVTAIYPKAVIQDNVVNYIVTLAISDSLGKTLRPEMTTNVSIFLEMRRQVLAVPTQAITREGGERFVTVIDGDKKIPRRVEIGWKDKGMSEILSGLKENEIILIPDTNKEDNL